MTFSPLLGSICNSWLSRSCLYPRSNRPLLCCKHSERFLFCCFLPKPFPSNLPLFLSVHPASCFSLKACVLGWQFLSSERSASLFLRSALILPTNRRGAPPTERLLIGKSGRQVYTSRGSQEGRGRTLALAARESVSVRARTARRSRGACWGLCRGKFPVPSRR